MRLRDAAGPVAVLCVGLVFGATLAAFTDGAASARNDGRYASVRDRSVRPQTPSGANDDRNLPIVGIPRDGTRVPAALIPPSLRAVFPRRSPPTRRSPRAPE